MIDQVFIAKCEDAVADEINSGMLKNGGLIESVGLEPGTVVQFALPLARTIAKDLKDNRDFQQAVKKRDVDAQAEEIGSRILSALSTAFHVGVYVGRKAEIEGR